MFVKLFLKQNNKYWQIETSNVPRTRRARCRFSFVPNVIYLFNSLWGYSVGRGVVIWIKYNFYLFTYHKRLLRWVKERNFLFSCTILCQTFDYVASFVINWSYNVHVYLSLYTSLICIILLFIVQHVEKWFPLYEGSLIYIYLSRLINTHYYKAGRNDRKIYFMQAWIIMYAL